MVALEPRERPDPGEQLGLVERLGEEVVGAGLEPLQALRTATGGDHHDREELGAWVLPDPAADLAAVHAGHLHVEQDDVDLRRLEQVEGLLPARGGQHLVVAWREHGVEESQVRRLVVDREHRLARHDPPPARKRSTCAGSERGLIGFSR